MAILNSESVHTPTLLNQMHLKKFPEHRVYDLRITQQFSGKSTNIILTSKRRGKHVSNKNIRYKKEDWKEEVALSPFLHSKQWFHQDKSLKSVITLIFFFNKKAWVGREREQSEKQAWAGQGREAHLIHLQ